MLSSLGLKDPWARNEVWRFDRRNLGMADRPVLIRRLLSRGFFPGLGLAVVTAGTNEKVLVKLIHNPSLQEFIIIWSLRMTTDIINTDSDTKSGESSHVKE